MLTHSLASYAATTSYAQVPAAAIQAAKIVLLDGLANAVAGSVQPGPGRTRDYYLSLEGAAQSSVLGTASRLPAPAAALLNAVSMHCLDFEVQGYPSAHGTSSILPAVLAVAERDGASGTNVLTSFVVGWEVQQRLRSAGANEQLRGFHPPGMVGPLAAAAAVANLVGLDADQTANALGIAASRTGGLFANNGTMTKALHPGNAARSGVEAVDLTLRGVTSNPAIIEAHRGYAAAVFGSQFDTEVALQGLGSTYHLVEPGYNIKPYPAEIYMQWAIEAVTLLKEEEQLDPASVTEIIVEPPVFRQDLSRPSPESGLEGKFSFQYCAAVALTEDHVGIRTFTDEVRFRPDVVDALTKVRLVENPDIPHDKKSTWCTVTVHTTDGRRLHRTCRSYRGSIANPMPEPMHRAKVADCFSAAGLGNRAGLVVEAIDHLDQREDIQPLIELLVTN